MGNSVVSMIEDHLGNIWFGGVFGISRFDGVGWRSFVDTDGNGDSEISQVLEDRSGDIWAVSLYGPVSRYDGTSWTIFDMSKSGLGGTTIRLIYEDRSGNLWFVPSGPPGVARFDGATWKTFAPSLLQGAYVFAVLEDRAGNLWFGTSKGLGRFDGVNWKTFTAASDGLANDTIVSLLEDHDGNIWAGHAQAAVSEYDGTTWSIVRAGGEATSVTSIVEDRAGVLWFAGAGAGVSRYDGSGWQSITKADGLVSDAVSCLLGDRSGNLWIGTDAGVSRYDKSDWRNFRAGEGPSYGGVRSVLEDKSGSFWFGTGGGLNRYDGVSWKTFTQYDGLASTDVTPVLEDRSGNLWVGTTVGASRYDGTSWQTPLPGPYVLTIFEDHSGALWFGTYGSGLIRYDGLSWQTFTTADSLADGPVDSIIEDDSGNIWIGTDQGLSRYDGASWRRFTTADGLPSNILFPRLKDRSGDLWFAGEPGVSQYDGTSWQTFTAVDSLKTNYATSILEDRTGAFWFGTLNGVIRFDGANSHTLIPGTWVNQVYEDRAGVLWFVTQFDGVFRYAQDFVPPRTVFLSVPPRVSASREQSAVFGAVLEIQGIQYSYRLDGGAWSTWSQFGSVFLTALGQGAHVLEARTQDEVGNVDPSPVRTTFEVDADPPAPVISSPAFGTPVKSVVDVRGTASDPRFASYRVELRPSGAASWSGATLLTQSTTQVVDGSIASWDTRPLQDGSYDVRLSVTDSLGLTGNAIVSVVVDNHPPFFDETTPAKIPAATGGDVYTTNADTHLYFPPHAFTEDAVVMVTPSPAGATPSTLPSGAVKVLDGDELVWAGTLRKEARFTVSFRNATIPTGTLSLYRSADGTNWERLGGTVDPKERTISLGVSSSGRYALFTDNGQGSGSGLSGIAFTPRVFSPSGHFADREVGISFILGRPAPVTVKVFSRSGRLIREVVEGQPLGAGANLVRWDGRDRNGGYATDGVYLVTVEALGHTESKPLAVVR